MPADRLHPYAHDGHWEWLEARGFTPSPLGREVANVLGLVGSGLYNCPVRFESTDWSDPRCIEVNWGGELANWDFPGLSILWAECHRRLLRVNIAPGSPRTLKLVFHQRETREGPSPVRMPSAREMLTMVERMHGEGE